MKLKNILIVVKDIEKSRKFYQDLFGIELVLDNDGNMILTEGLVLQDEKIWKSFLDRDIIPRSNSCELYFEEQDIESFVKKLEENEAQIALKRSAHVCAGETQKEYKKRPLFCQNGREAVFCGENSTNFHTMMCFSRKEGWRSSVRRYRAKR
jgi:catechol 2,3-dioxygenase-like lactoylglutathione lyase family enzyme